MRNELKPCPFCGGKATHLYPFSAGSTTCSIRCTICGASRDGGKLQDTGLSERRWNEREPERESSVDLGLGAAAIDSNAFTETYDAKHYYPKNASELFRKRRVKALRQAERCAKAWGLEISEKGAATTQIEVGKAE